MRLAADSLFQRRGNARLADARLAGDQHDLAASRLGARPAPQQQSKLFIAANQRGQCRSPQRLEPALANIFAQYLPAAGRLGATGSFECAELPIVEQAAGQAPGGGLDRYDIGLRR